MANNGDEISIQLVKKACVVKTEEQIQGGPMFV